MYTFTCPLEGCNNQMMTVQTDNEHEAAEMLTAIAELHLKHAHPQVNKTHEEVAEDIKAHMSLQK